MNYKLNGLEAKINIHVKYEHAQCYTGRMTSKWKFMFLKCLFSSKFVFFCNIVRSLPFPFSPMLRIKKPALNQKLIFIFLMTCLYTDLVSYLSIYISFPQGFIHQYIYIYIPTQIYTSFLSSSYHLTIQL